MPKLVLFSLLALALLPAAASARSADGCPPSSCGAQSVTAPGSRLLYVRPAGSQGPLTAYDLASGVRRFSLAAGLLSFDGTRYFTTRFSGSRTIVGRLSTTSGRLLRAWPIRGQWLLAGISADGTRLVLGARKNNGRHTRLAVFSVDGGRIVRTLPLAGWWEVDTISNDGLRLYLIQHAGSVYSVRLYDVASGRLRPGSLRVKGEDETMTGIAWGAVGTPDGSYLLTLYLDTENSKSFVHALDLRSSTARCIDLPTGNGMRDFATLSQYVLSLAPGGNRLLAANPAAGVVAELDLRQGKVVKVTRFRTPPPSGSLASSAIGAVSHDGRTLYFSTGGSIWAYDAAFGRVRGPYAAGRLVGMGFSPDDRRLYVVRAGGDVATLDAARGTTLRG
jgi:WD40 repeat protein